MLYIYIYIYKYIYYVCKSINFQFLQNNSVESLRKAGTAFGKHIFKSCLSRSVNGVNGVSRALVHSIESVVIDWTHQISKVLKRDSALPLIEGQNPTPFAELDFWKARATNLQCIFDQVRGYDFVLLFAKHLFFFQRVESLFILSVSAPMFKVECRKLRVQCFTGFYQCNWLKFSDIKLLNVT